MDELLSTRIRWRHPSQSEMARRSPRQRVYFRVRGRSPRVSHGDREHRLGDPIAPSHFSREASLSVGRHLISRIILWSESSANLNRREEGARSPTKLVLLLVIRSAALERD